MADIVTRTLAADHTTPVRAYAALRSHAPERSSFLLESAQHGERWGRYTVVGHRARNESMYPGITDAFDVLGRDWDALESGEGVAQRFSRAMVGFIAYDALHRALGIEGWPDEEVHARMMSDQTVVVFDHLHHTMTIAGRTMSAVNRCEWEMAHGPELDALAMPDADRAPEYVDPVLEDAKFEVLATRAKKAAVAGDVVQLVLARRFTTPQREADPLDVYRALRVLSPSPYLYFLEFGATPFAPALTVLGASPATMVRVTGGRVTLRPIAGVRRRGASESEDSALALAMLKDPFEVAHHSAVVELARAVVEEVCEPGDLDEMTPPAIELHGRGMHVVSEVSGATRVGRTPVDVVRAAFPSGALTGAPRRRAAQLIRELEPAARGIYGGAVGYLAPDGSVDLAIASNPIVFRNGEYQVTAGTPISSTTDVTRAAHDTREKVQIAVAAVRAAQDAVVERRERKEKLAAAKAAKAEREAAAGEKAVAQGDAVEKQKG